MLLLPLLLLRLLLLLLARMQSDRIVAVMLRVIRLIVAQCEIIARVYGRAFTIDALDESGIHAENARVIRGAGGEGRGCGLACLWLWAWGR